MIGIRCKKCGTITTFNETINESKLKGIRKCSRCGETIYNSDILECEAKPGALSIETSDYKYFGFMSRVASEYHLKTSENEKKIDENLDEVNELVESELLKKNIKECVDLKNADVGDKVLFGKNIWKVIKVEKTKKLLRSILCFSDKYSGITEKLIDEYKHFSSVSQAEEIIQEKEYRWKHSKLREYLNTYFINYYFKLDEFNSIVENEIIYHDIDKNIKLYDKVFILSKDEMETIIKDKNDRIGYIRPTPFTGFEEVNLPREYILRLDNENEYYCDFVTSDGDILKMNKEDCEVNHFVPCIWIKRN